MAEAVDGRAIAIVGVAGSFPGAPDLDSLWQRIVRRESAAREVPRDRWPVAADALLDPAGPPDRLVSTKGCFLDPFAFEADGLPLDPALIDALDPLHRLALSVGVDAFRSGDGASLDRRRIPVILANILLPTEAASGLTREVVGGAFETWATGAPSTEGESRRHAAALDRQPAALPAALIARALGLGGGSFTLDAACASSLYALHLACLELESGRSDAVLAGGVSRPQALYTQVGFSQLQALSPSGACLPFDSRADGLLVGEGACVFLLQRLEDAVRDGRTVLGVIRGIGLSNDIGGSLLSPETEGQLRAMRAAYAASGWRPDDVDLIECHGTGTPRGDAIELESLRTLWSEGSEQDRATKRTVDDDGSIPGASNTLRTRDHHARPSHGDAGCVIGSVKSNVGHLLTAAAAAGLAKVLLSLREETLPPTAGFAHETASPALARGPFRVLEHAEGWPRRAPGRPRRAAVSAFGFGGINAHLLVEEWIPSAAHASDAAHAVEATGAIEAARATEATQRAVTPDVIAVGSTQARPAIAIVGMATHFGPLRDLRAFRETTFRGEAVLSSRPADRWGGVEASDLGRGAAVLAELSELAGGWIDEIEIPLGKFRIPPRELPSLLPQQLLALQVAAAAVEDAGPLALGAAPRLRVGALVGLGLDLETTNFHLRWTLRDRARGWAEARGHVLDDAALDAWVDELLPSLGPPLDASRTLGALGGVVAGRVARELQLGGPSFSVAGEDTSGLRALELATRLLQAGDADTMIVGAVELGGDLRQILARDELRPWSRQGRARPFDRDADGPLPGEGAAAVVVKRYEDALRDGDRIYAVLRGIGAAGGGQPGSGPSEDTYGAALARAYEDAGVEPARVSLVAAHGSGSPEEDAVEASALRRFFGSRDEAVCALTATQAVVGHSGAASGLASVIQAALSLFHEILPPLAGFREPAGPEAWASSPFHMQREAQAWLRNRIDGPRIAGVSSMALDGSCLHAVLEGVERPASDHRQERARPLGDRGVGIFLCHGDDPAELDRSLAALRLHLEEDAPIEASAASWHRRVAAAGARALHEQADTADHEALEPLPPTSPTEEARPSSKLVRAFVGADRDEVLQQLDRPARGASLRGEIAFVFPGSGNHYIGMGRSLGAAFPEAIRALDAETLHLRDQMLPAWLAPWRASWAKGAEADAARALADAPARMILGQVAFGVAMNDVIRSLGVEPDAFLGYSLGETAGNFASRTWRDRDGMFGRTMASPLFRDQLSGSYEVAREAWGVEVADWHVVVVNRSADEVRAALAGTAALLIVNAPGECVIGGRRADVEAVVEALESEALPLIGVPSVHCKLVDPVAEAYRLLHVQPTTPPPGVRMYSCAWARSFEPNDESAADSILANAVGGFDFRAAVEQAWRDGVRIFVELGPQGSCTRMIGRILAGKEHLAVSACQRDRGPARSILQTLARLAEAGVSIDFDPLYGPEGDIESTLQETRGPSVVVKTGRPRPILPPLPGRPTGRPPSTAAIAVAATAPRSAPPLALAAAHQAPLASTTITAPRSNPRMTYPETQRDPIAAIAGPSPSPWPLPAPRTLPLHPSRYSEGSFTMPPPHLADPLASLIADLGDLTRGVLDRARSTVETHARFVEASQTSMQLQQLALANGEQLRRQLELAAANGVSHVAAPIAAPIDAPIAALAPQTSAPASGLTPPAFDRDACMEFAIGKLANVLGPAFADADTYPSRVRLPDEPLMLCDRIVSVEGTLGQLGRGRCVTEHDVLAGAWYLDGGRAPVCISVEAGQADLFLCSYLGIDLITKGERVYRLLDAQVIFHRDLPRPGETIRYDIRVDRFIRQGDTHLLFFEFDGTIDGEKLITMRGGCAGFFSPKQLSSGRGIVGELGSVPPPRRLDANGVETAPFQPLIPIEPAAYDDDALAALRAGDLAGCFGPLFEGITLPPALRLPGGRMKLVDRIIELDPAGGRYGLGTVTGEADIEPDAWFLTCHFSDDPVMPGTLMYECCLHTLRVLLLRLGWVCDEASTPPDLFYSPVVGQPSKLRCRGQVTPTTRQARYRIDIKEIGYDPEPYVLADASMFVDELHGVEMESMSVRLAGLRREDFERLWSQRASPVPGGVAAPQAIAAMPRGSVASSQTSTGASHPSAAGAHPSAAGAHPSAAGTHPSAAGAHPSAAGAHPSAADPLLALFADPHLLPVERTGAGRPIYDRRHIEAFATGRPSQAFGGRYRRFDKGRMARLPADPFSFIDRIVPDAGSPWRLERGAAATAHYAVPPDAWYFDANRSDEIPYSVLLEIALQPCGWLAAWLGAALTHTEPLFFRNLEGDATFHAAVDRASGTLRTSVSLGSVSEAGGMILLEFDFETASDEGAIFSGTTRFGFFPAKALAQQAGLRLPEGGIWRPEPAAQGAHAIPATPPLLPGDAAPASRGRSGPTKEEPHDVGGEPTPGNPSRERPLAESIADGKSPYALGHPAGAYRLLDRIDSLLLERGPHGQGFVSGSKRIDPGDWFFAAHFHGDPVMPGSLGLEAFLQLLRHWALARWPSLAASHRFVAMPAPQPHRWIYRGQILPDTAVMEVVAAITSVDDGPSPKVTASGFLLADGKPIYEIVDFALQLIPLEA